MMSVRAFHILWRLMLLVSLTVFSLAGAAAAQEIARIEVVTEDHVVVVATDILSATTLGGPNFRVDEVDEYVAPQGLTKRTEMEKTKQIAEAAESSFTGVGNLFLHPVDTVTEVPTEVFRYVTRLGEMVRNDRNEFAVTILRW